MGSGTRGGNGSSGPRTHDGDGMGSEDPKMGSEVPKMVEKSRAKKQTNFLYVVPLLESSPKMYFSLSECQGVTFWYSAALRQLTVCILSGCPNFGPS